MNLTGYKASLKRMIQHKKSIEKNKRSAVHLERNISSCHRRIKEIKSEREKTKGDMK